MENNKLEEKKDIFSDTIEAIKEKLNDDTVLRTNIYDGPSDSLEDMVDEKLDLSKGISFEKVYVPEVKKEAKIDGNVYDTVNVDVKKVVEDFRRPGKDLLKSKVDAISIGKMVTVIHGDFDNQKVLKGRIVSMIDSGVTVIDQDETVEDPVVVPYDRIIDIFEVKKFKKAKEPFSMFKLNKKVREFFTGTEEELKHAYEQKITVKKLRNELKKKDKK
jgi:hypothetical protein